MKENFDRFIALVWPPNGDFDSPKGGYQVTPGDPGGGTKGGVIESTWQSYVAKGLVAGALRDASDDSLKTVLRAEAWGTTCDTLPPGLDVLIANGRMMTGAYASLVEIALGWTGANVDNIIGPHDLALLLHSDPATLVWALHGMHWNYLSHLPTWGEFGKGWTRRLDAAKAVALGLIQSSGDGTPIPSTNKVGS